MSTDEWGATAAARRPPGAWLQIGSLLAPVLKCAFCPVCLGLFGSALAGARLGFLADERFHFALIAVAVVFDIGILGAAFRHHQRRAPLLLCGFGALTIAALWNVILLRRHHHSSACCAHDRVGIAREMP